VRLELDAYRGAVSPRVVLRAACPCAPAGIDVIGAPDGELAAVLSESEALGAAAPVPAPVDRPSDGTRVLDRRGAGAAGAIADLVAAGAPVLVICADVARRLDGLQRRIGGFALTDWDAVARDPRITRGHAHLALLDPPMHPLQRAALAPDRDSAVHLLWGPGEIAFSERILEREYALRAPLGALYRALRAAGGAAGDTLHALLLTDGAHGRSVGLAARLLAVLAELGLVELRCPGLAVEMAGDPRPTSLERSSLYRGYTCRYEEGRRYLRQATPPSPS
jgi:single-stranded-DNA-specific exonuclease